MRPQFTTTVSNLARCSRWYAYYIWGVVDRAKDLEYAVIACFRDALIVIVVLYRSKLAFLRSQGGQLTCIVMVHYG